MKTQTSLSACIVFAIFASIPIAGRAAVLTPDADAIVEDGISGPRDGVPDEVIDNSTVQALDTPDQEDRAVIEFSLAGLALPISVAKLVLPVSASTGPFPFTIDVFAYSGDGQVTLSDWKGGARVASFDYREQRVVRVDVTSAVRAAVRSGAQFVGFRLKFSEPSSIPLNGPFVAFSSIEVPPPATLRVNERTVGGSVNGVVPIQVVCQNLTTGQRATIALHGDNVWDCREAGLDVRQGDQIKETVTGRAK